MTMQTLHLAFSPEQKLTRCSQETEKNHSDKNQMQL